MIAYGCVAGIVHRGLQPLPERAARLETTRVAHGTTSCYSAGCRCALCKAARSDYRRGLYERRKAGLR